MGTSEGKTGVLSPGVSTQLPRKGGASDLR